MSYKSYAQGGQFNTYSINLPIKAEINEDLRAAGDFAAQMERAQQYREKWAGSYLSALNKKSGIERQNRDDNFEFLQKNFKAIYEGEQREFEGRLAELRREQAEAANADPGFWDDLLPSLIKLAPQIASMAAGMHAAHQAGQQQLATDVLNKTNINPAELGAQQRFQQSDMVTLSDKAQVFEAFHRNHASNVSAEDLQTVLRMTGENQMHSQLVAWRNDLPRVANQLKKISAVGSGERFDASLPIWRGQQAKYIQEFQKYSQEVVSDSFPFPDQNYYSDTVNFGIVQKSVRSIQNGIFNKNSNVWETIAAGHNKQHITNQLDTALGLGEQAILAHFDSRVEHFSKDPNLTPQEARLEAVNEFSANWLKGSGTHPQYVAFRQALDAQKSAAFNKKNGTKGQRIPRGGPVDDALDRMGIAIRNRDNQIQSVHNTTLRNQQKKDAENFGEEYSNIYKNEGPVAAANFLKQAQGMDFSSNPELDKKIKGMASHSAVLQPYVKPTFAQRSGISQDDLDRAATDVAIGGLPTTAANNALGAAKLAKLNGNRIAIDKIKGYIQANFDASVRKYAGILKPGSEEFLQQIAFDAHQVMSKAGALPITNPDGKDATAVSAYNFQVGTNNINNKTVEYNELTKQKPKEYHPLYATDRLQFENYGKAVQKVLQEGGDMNTPAQIQYRVDLHNMPAVIERAATLGITKDEALDQILENLGYPDAIQNPFTEADRNTNSEILNRLHNNYKLTTIQGRQATIDAKRGTLQFANYVPAATFGTSEGYGYSPSRGRDHWSNDHLVPNRTPTTTLVPNGTVTDVKMDNGAAGNEYTVSYNYGGHTVDVRSLHNDEVHVQPGQVVNPGDVIGLSGSTGRSTGPHTHNEYYVDGAVVDGAKFLINGKPIQEIFLGYAK